MASRRPARGRPLDVAGMEPLFDLADPPAVVEPEPVEPPGVEATSLLTDATTAPAPALEPGGGERLPDGALVRLAGESRFTHTVTGHDDDSVRVTTRGTGDAARTVLAGQVTGVVTPDELDAMPARDRVALTTTGKRPDPEAEHVDLQARAITELSEVPALTVVIGHSLADGCSSSGRAGQGRVSRGTRSSRPCTGPGSTGDSTRAGVCTAR